MKLYGSLTSPYVRKVRVLLKEKDIACEFVIVDAWAADSPVPGMNPLGTVPVLERDDGRFLFDSPLICEYLDAEKRPALIPGEGEARWQVLQWHALAQGMLDATVTRLLESRRPPERQSADQIARQEAKIARALAWAERGATGEFLIGDRFGFADLALGVALDYIDFRYPHPWRERHPGLGEWHARIGARPSFMETLPPGLERPAAAKR
jgi:glutathione S-transferase